MPMLSLGLIFAWLLNTDNARNSKAPRYRLSFSGGIKLSVVSEDVIGSVRDSGKKLHYWPSRHSEPEPSVFISIKHQWHIYLHRVTSRQIMHLDTH